MANVTTSLLLTSTGLNNDKRHLWKVVSIWGGVLWIRVEQLASASVTLKPIV